MSTPASLEADNSYDYHTIMSRVSCKYLPEISAGTGFATSVGGTITSIILKCYIFTPFGVVGAAGFAGCYFYSRKVRMQKDETQAEGGLLQNVMEKASQVASQKKSAPLDKAKVEAERKLDEELLKRKIDTSRLKEVTISLADERDALIQEKTMLQKDLDGLLEQLEGYRDENEGMYKKALEIGKSLIQEDLNKLMVELGAFQGENNSMYIQAVQANKSLELVGQNTAKQVIGSKESFNESHVTQVKSNAAALHTKGKELFGLLNSFIEKLSKEKESLSRKISNQAKDEMATNEMLIALEELEAEVTRLSKELETALNRIKELEEERKKWMEKIQKS